MTLQEVMGLVATTGRQAREDVAGYFKPTTDLFDPMNAIDPKVYRNIDMQPYTLKENQEARKFGAIRKLPITNKEILGRALMGGAGLGDVLPGVGVAGAVAQKALKPTRKVFNDVMELARQGIKQKNWYRKSGQAMLDATQGNLPRAKDLANFTSIVSPSTAVRENLGHGARMYYQKLMGDKLRAGIFPSAMGRSADEYVRGGEKSIGPKRGPFFNNILKYVDPSLPQRDVTNDIWGARAWDLPTDSPSARQHQMMTHETQRIAKKLGLEPEQTQASYWSAIKAKIESLPRALREKAKTSWQEKLLPQQIRRPMELERRSDLRQAALNAEVPEDLINKAGYDFANAMDDHTGLVSWEAIPSRESGLMPEIHDAPFSVRMNFTEQMDSILGDTIEKELGILTNKRADVMGTGFYQEGAEASYNPSKQIGVIMPLGPGGRGTGKIDPSAGRAVELYAAIRGKLTYQHGMGYTRPFPAQTVKGAGGFELDFGRPLTHGESREIMVAIEKHPDLQKVSSDGTLIPAVYFNPSKNGIHIYHDFVGDHTKFNKALDSLLADDALLPGVEATGHSIGSDGGLIGGYGESYESIIRRNGGEVQERRISSLLSEKIKGLYRKTAQEQGYKDPFQATPSAPAEVAPALPQLPKTDLEKILRGGGVS